jgi:hypothetical protein
MHSALSKYLLSSMLAECLVDLYFLTILLLTVAGIHVVSLTNFMYKCSVFVRLSFGTHIKNTNGMQQLKAG